MAENLASQNRRHEQQTQTGTRFTPPSDETLAAADPLRQIEEQLAQIARIQDQHTEMLATIHNLLQTLPAPG